MSHTLDKSKVEAELLKRGWKRGIYGEWITPAIYSYEQSEKDWTEATLAGIVCVHEERIKQQKEFLRKHPVRQRQM